MTTRVITITACPDIQVIFTRTDVAIISYSAVIMGTISIIITTVPAEVLEEEAGLGDKKTTVTGF